MVKLIILFRTGALRQDHARYNDFLMKLEALPGLRRKSVSTVFGAMGGKLPYSTVVEAAFDSREALQAALTSEAGIEAGRLLLSFGGPDVAALYVDTLEEAFGGAPSDPGR